MVNKLVLLNELRQSIEVDTYFVPNQKQTGDFDELMNLVTENFLKGRRTHSPKRQGNLLE